MLAVGWVDGRVGNGSLGDDKISHFSAGEEGGINASIERGEFAFVVDGEGQEVEIAEVSGGRELGEGLAVYQRQGVGPKLVAGVGAEVVEESSRLLRGTGAFGVIGVADDAEETVFREWTGGPTFIP